MLDKEALYNALDSARTYELYEKIFPELSQSRHVKTYDRTIRMIEPLAAMMTRGISVDVEGIKEEKLKVEEQIKKAQKLLNELCGEPLNPFSAKECQNYFYIKKGLTPFVKQVKQKDGSRKSTITTDDLAMRKLAVGTKNRKPIFEAALVQKIRGLRKLLSTYLEIQLDPDNRFRYSVNIRGTIFSRISTSKTITGSGMNVQNLDPRYKKYLRADPGKLLLEIDKRQAEWIVTAYACNDENMIHVVESGEDIHTYTGTQMFKETKEHILEEAELLGHTNSQEIVEDLRKKLSFEVNDSAPRNMSMRQAAKKAGHSLNYGLGYKTFAERNEFPEHEAKRIVELYHKPYPGIRQWHRFIQDSLKKSRVLKNCFDRYQLFLDRWGDSLFKAAYAFIPQSTVGDLIADAICDIYESKDPFLKDVELLAQVHDSILFQIPEYSDHSEIAKRLNKYMSPTLEYNSRKFVIPSDAKIGTHWDEHSMKEIKL